MYVSVKTPPSPIVTWTTAKAHLRRDSDDEQALVEGYIAAATAWLDGPGGWLGAAIGRQTLQASFEGFHCLGKRGLVKLPYAPIFGQPIVTYFDAAGGEQTLPDDGYVVVFGSGLAMLGGVDWPQTERRADAVTVEYVAGFDTPPPAIVQAVLLLVGHWYANRETVNIGNISTSLPFAVDALLGPFRHWNA